MKTIFAVDNKWGLGKKNDLLFSLKEDMRHFVAHTKGKTVVMGSNTLLSFPNGMPLKNRTNIVLNPNGTDEDAKAATQIVLNAGYKKVNAAPVVQRAAQPKAAPVQYAPAPQPAPQPVYQSAPQPVYQQPAQPVYQQPVAPQPAPAAPAAPAQTQQQSEEAAQMALLLEQFNKIIASDN